MLVTLPALHVTEVPGSPLGNTETSDLYKAFQERNRVENSLATFDLSFPGSVRFLSRSERSKIFEQGSWDTFYAQYPGMQGYATLILPGYSANKQTALVTIDRKSARRSGWGELVRLTKKNRRRQVSETLLSRRY